MAEKRATSASSMVLALFCICSFPDPARPRENGDPVLWPWIPAFAGMSGRVLRMSASCLEPGADRLDQRLAQAGVFDAFDRVADESLNQQGFGFGVGNPARAQ